MKNSSFSILLFGLIVLAMTASVGMDFLMGQDDGKRVARAESVEPHAVVGDRLMADLEGLLAGTVSVYQGLLECEGLSDSAYQGLHAIKEAHKGDLLLIRDQTGNRSGMTTPPPSSGRDPYLKAIAMEESISAKCLEILHRSEGNADTKGMARMVNGNAQWALRGLRELQVPAS